MDKGTIEFIIPVYRTLNEAFAFAYSLLCQTSDSWVARFIFDGDKDGYDKFVAADFPSKMRAEIIEGPNKDWGHTPREYGKDTTSSEWIVMTGVDNYYCPTFVEEFTLYTSRPEIDFVYCDMVHDGYGYQPFESRPAFNYIDIGNFAIRASIAKQIPLNKTYAADGEFVEEFMKRFSKEDNVAKVYRYLYVHN